MRIPPSVIVMSVVTAVPFGLGVRDTFRHEDAGADDVGLGFGSRQSAREQAELEAYEAEMRAEQMEREARAKARLDQLDQLFGAKPAAMGSLLDGIVLGASAGSFQPEHVRRRIELASRDGLITVSFDVDAKSLNGVEVAVNSDYETVDACDKLGEKLGAAWGASTNGVWLDPATHQRAALDLDDCRLRFERYVESAAWVAQLPLAAIGASADALTEQLAGAGNADLDGDRVYWSAPGLRYGKAETRLEAYVVNGKIVGFKATVDSDFDSTLAVRDALSAKLKAQPTKNADDAAEDLNVWEWKRRVPVSLDQFDTDRFSVLVGKMPWD